jgi:hypothetical protein
MSRVFLRSITLALALALLALPLAAQPARPSHLIQISLLAASRSGPNELADLPQNTRQAIEDVRQFLPFKSYRLLDTALLRSDRVARTMLTGPDDREFRASFSLNLPYEPGELVVQNFELIEKIALPPSLLSTGGDTKPPASPASKQVLSSSFTAKVGQTVVVGTSRLDAGDHALMVLFTALP